MAIAEAGYPQSPGRDPPRLCRRHPDWLAAVGWDVLHDCGRGAPVVPRRPPQAADRSPPGRPVGSKDSYKRAPYRLKENLPANT
jgi:hypothetical protein